MICHGMIQAVSSNKLPVWFASDYPSYLDLQIAAQGSRKFSEPFFDFDQWTKSRFSRKTHRTTQINFWKIVIIDNQYTIHIIYQFNLIILIHCCITLKSLKIQNSNCCISAICQYIRLIMMKIDCFTIYSQRDDIFCSIKYNRYYVFQLLWKFYIWIYWVANVIREHVISLIDQNKITKFAEFRREVAP